jgi:hypothetical protein
VNALNMIVRSLRRIFHSKPDDGDLAPGAAARALAEFLSGGVEGSSLIWCGCGKLLVPVVYSNGGQAEVVALGCPAHGCIPVALGVLIEGAAPETQSIG